VTRVIYIASAGTRREIEGKAGDTVMSLAVRNGIKGIEAECGGALACATCHIYVAAGDAAGLPPPSEDERAMLEGVAAERRPSSRLACQIVLGSLPALTVQLPERQT
jgi:ferredoxin, 2Fe-2S